MSVSSARFLSNEVYADETRSPRTSADIVTNSPVPRKTAFFELSSR
ncbi:MAG TPA: hypothetical protein VMK12_00590 [Anaeromyxobacteraceae bacterium]|nr:hypothetical protein [Anaeromyxobacteraceae bacterium]